MSDRDPSHLCPELQAIWPKFVEKCASAGIVVFLTATWRLPADQNAAAAGGASKATAGHSPHNHVDADGNPCSLAFDFGVKKQGIYVKDGTDPYYAHAGAIGKGLGLSYGGDWTLKADGCKPDWDHLQMPNWRRYGA